MRLARCSLSAIVALTLFVAQTVQSVAAAAPLEINVILSLTGQAAFIGHEEQTALAITEAYVNSHGGIRNRPVHFSIQDDQSSPQVGVQLADALVAKKVPVFLGPSLSAVCAALMPIVLEV